MLPISLMGYIQPEPRSSLQGYPIQISSWKSNARLSSNSSALTSPTTITILSAVQSGWSPWSEDAELQVIADVANLAVLHGPVVCHSSGPAGDPTRAEAASLTHVDKSIWSSVTDVLGMDRAATLPA